MRLPGPMRRGSSWSKKSRNSLRPSWRLRRQKEQIEDELETSREQWRSERRRLTNEIEELEAEVERARKSRATVFPMICRRRPGFNWMRPCAQSSRWSRTVAAQARWETERAD